MPNFTKPFEIETDASDLGVGAVLQQGGHPIAFVSRALGPKSRGLSTYEKEYLAILLAVEHWRPYLHHSEFIIKTDQKSLIHLDDQKVSTPWQQKALTKLLGLQYKIQYKKGCDNRVADALSRVCHPSTSEALALSMAQPTWLAEVQHAYLSDEVASKLLTTLSTSSPVGHYKLVDGLIKYKDRIWVGNSTTLHSKILHALHSSAIGGHSGYEATYNRVKKLFAWPGLKHSIKEFVAQCTICQQAKSERVAYPGLLSPLPVPDGAWQVVTMDFIEGLPKSAQFNCILVVVDKFSRYAHFLPLTHPFTAFQVALSFMNNVFKLHGLPAAIVSDRDRIFTSHFWQELFKLTGTDLRMSSAYHPQSDGQTERVNQCLETYLRCFVHACPTKWSQWLPLAEFWYNTSYHSTLDKTPFLVLYGHEPRQLGIDGIDCCQIPDLKQWLQERSLMQQLLQQHLLRAQKHMKLQADKKRTARSFEVGDLVYLKVQPYVQTSLAQRSSNKLAFRYFGPFRILSTVGTVAYKLQLPENSLVHPVFHVSMLKKAVHPHVSVSQHFPDLSHKLQVPQRVLDRRLLQRHDSTISQVLVQWSHWPVELSTWEDEEALHQQFPQAPAWGQAGSQGGGDVTDQLPAPTTTPRAKGEREAARRHRKPNTRFVGPDWIANVTG